MADDDSPSAPEGPASGQAEDDAQHLLGMAAHEIKNLLGPLSLTLQLCERRLAQKEPIAKDDLAFARAQVQRLSALVNDLLDTSRIDAGQFPLRVRTVDLGALVSGVLDSFRRMHNHRLVTDLPTEPMAISADGDRLAAVLTNFLDNAAKYAPENSAIDVRITRAGGRARLSVSDAGPGISAESQTQLFQRYFRAPETAETTRGLGLGLYLSRIIVERHGGTVGVSSTSGKGATFWLELPLGQG